LTHLCENKTVDLFSKILAFQVNLTWRQCIGCFKG